MNNNFDHKLTLIELFIKNHQGSPKRLKQEAYEIQQNAYKANKKNQLSYDEYEVIRHRVNAIMRSF